MRKLLRKLFWPEDDRVRLPEMMALRGAREPIIYTDAVARDAARATRRCMRCSAKQACDAYLAAGDASAYRGFCPNAPYIDSLR